MPESGRFALALAFSAFSYVCSLADNGGGPPTYDKDIETLDIKPTKPFSWHIDSHRRHFLIVLVSTVWTRQYYGLLSVGGKIIVIMRQKLVLWPWDIIEAAAIVTTPLLPHLAPHHKQCCHCHSSRPAASTSSIGYRQPHWVVVSGAVQQ